MRGARIPTLTKNAGERKFSINQNLTVLFVLRRTLRIIIDANRYGVVELECYGLCAQNGAYLVQ